VLACMLVLNATVRCGINAFQSSRLKDDETYIDIIVANVWLARSLNPLQELWYALVVVFDVPKSLHNSCTHITFAVNSFPLSDNRILKQPFLQTMSSRRIGRTKN